MADFSKTGSSGWGSSPAAPAGGPEPSRGPGRWQQESNMSRFAQAGGGMKSWFGGQNIHSKQNGWNTSFVRAAMEQRDEFLDRAAKSGNPGEYFDWLDPEKNKRATGVALWDDDSKGITRGDVFVDGVKQHRGNLYEVYDERDADLLMARFMFDGDTQARLNRADDPAKAYREAVKRATDANTAQVEHAADAWRQKRETERMSRETSKGLFDDWMSAGGGAAAGALLGSWVPGVGTAVGALVGGTVGGFAGWLNRDQFTQSLSRIRYRSAEAGRTQGGFEAGLSWLQGGGELLLQGSMAPTNLYQGTIDELRGTTGDGRNQYYDVDPDTGELKVGVAGKAGGLLAMVGDAMLQFANPATAAFYMLSLGAQTVGKAGSMAATDAVWVPEYGKYEDMQGLGEHLAGWGGVGIDMLQLGAAGGIARGSAAMRKQFGEGKGLARGEAAPLDEKVAGVGDRVWRALRGKEAPRQGPDVLEPMELSGRRFFFNPDGTVHSSRLTLSALVPSEAMRWLPAGMQARYAAMRRSGQVTQDDLFEASLRMSGTGGRFPDAVMNSFAEGTEEAVQAVLDPMAYGERPEPGVVYESMLAGMASGFGMSVGAMAKRPTNDIIKKDYARQLEVLRTGTPISKEEWNGRWKNMSSAERHKAAAATPAQAKQIQQLWDAAAELREMKEGSTSVVGRSIMAQARMKTFEGAVQNVNPNTELVGQLHGSTIGRSRDPSTPAVDHAELPGNGVGMSLAQVARSFELKHTAMKLQAETIQSRRAKLTADLASAQERGVQSEVDLAQQRLDEVLLEELETTGRLAWMRTVRDWVAESYDVIMREQDENTFNNLVDAFNSIILNAQAGVWLPGGGQQLGAEDAEHLRVATEVQFGRHPFIDEGSFAILVPQVSISMTKSNNHGAFVIHQSLLKAMQGDNDGDTLVTLNAAYIDPAKRRELRLGGQILQKDERPDVTKEESARELDDPISKKSVWKVVADAPEGERMNLQDFQGVFLQQTTQEYAELVRGLQELADKIMARYSGQGAPFEVSELRPLVEKFIEDVKGGDPDSRMNLVNGMVNLRNGAGGRLILDMGESTGQQEIASILNMISMGFHDMQLSLGKIAFTRGQAYRNRYGDDVAPPTPYEKVSLKFLEEVRLKEAAALSHDLVAMFGPVGERSSQHGHYWGAIRSAVDLEGMDQAAMIPPDLAIEIARVMLFYGSGESLTSAEKIEQRDDVTARVRGILRDIAESAHKEFSGQPQSQLKSTVEQLMFVIGNMRVPSLSYDQDGNPTHDGGEDVTFLQYLLNMSIQKERKRQAGTLADDPIWAKLDLLETYCHKGADHSYTPSLAMMEVYGDIPIIRLLGQDAAGFWGAHLTMRQLQELLISQGRAEIANTLEVWRTCPLYIHSGPGEKQHRGDPPWSAREFKSGSVNGFTVVLDTVAAVANTHFKNLKAKSDRYEDKARTGFKEWRVAFEMFQTEFVTDIRAYHGLSKNAKPTDQQVLQYILETRPEFADTIASLVPESAWLGTVAVIDGRIRVADWVERMLLEKSHDKAMLMQLVEPLFDEYNVLSGTRDPVKRDVRGVENVPGIVHEDRINSRLLLLIHELAARNTSLELARFMELYKNARSVKAFMDAVNENPEWTGTRPKFLPYVDGRAEFSSDPRQIWSGTTRNKDMYDALGEFADKMTRYSRTAKKQKETYAKNKVIVSEMQKEFTRLEKLGSDPVGFKNQGKAQGPDASGTKRLQQLEQAIERKKKFPPVNGPIARDIFMEMVQQGTPHLENKGGADKRAKAMGEWLCTATYGGFAPGWELEASAMGHYDIAQIRQVPHILVTGPTRVMMEDGTVTTIDLSTLKGALYALRDPGLTTLVMMALGDTHYDVNAQGNLQLFYNMQPDSDGVMSITQMLDQSQVAAKLPPKAQDMTEAQADAIIAMAESYSKNITETDDNPEVRKKGLFPVQRIIDELLVAYSTRPGYEKLSQSQLKSLRIQAKLDVARTLMLIAQTPKAQRARMAQELKRHMHERWSEGDTTGKDMKKLNRLKQAQQTAIKTILINASSKGFEQRISALDTELRARQQLESELQNLQSSNRTWTSRTRRANRIAQITARLAAMRTTAQIEDDLAKVVLDSERDAATVQDLFDFKDPIVWEFQKCMNGFFPDYQSDQAMDNSKRELLIDYLRSNGRVSKQWQTGKPNKALHQKFMARLENMATASERDSFTEEEWEQLAVVATKIYLADKSVRSGSDVIHAFSVSNKPDDLRLWDQTGSYLVDNFFQPSVLEALDVIGEMSGMDRETVDRDKAIQWMLNTGTFKQDKFGDWLPVIPAVTEMMQKALDGSPVGLSIPLGGSSPVENFELVGASWAQVNVQIDPAAHHTTLSLTGDYMAMTPEEWLESIDPSRRTLVKVHNHFVKEVQFLGASIPVGQQQGELLTYPVESVTSDYQVFDINRLYRVLVKLRDDYNAMDPALRPTDTTFSLDIEYVDVDKKPYVREHATNPLFDGVGRNAETMGTNGPFAAMIFGGGAISKLLQQNPLDFAARGGSAFATYVARALREVEQMERAAGSATELMHIKALRMLIRRYEFGYFMLDDLPGLYKLMKMSHVYKGVDPQGVERYMWAEEVIAYENDPSTPTTWNSRNLQLIPLSKTVRTKLLGGGITAKPFLTPADADRFPSLSPERLRQLDLSDLGTYVPPNKSRLTHFGDLPIASRGNDPRGTDVIPSEYLERERRGYQDKMRKDDYRKVLEQKNLLNRSRQRKSNTKRTIDELSTEEQVFILSRIGVPLHSQADPAAAKFVKGALEASLQTETPDYMFWSFDVDGPYNFAKGRLNDSSFINDDIGGTEQLDSGGPTWGDVFALNLSKLLDSRQFEGDYEKAQNYAMRLVKAMSKRGVKIILTADQGHLDFRAMIARYMTQSLEYQAVDGSTIMFVPFTERTADSLTKRALEANKLHTRYFTPDTAQLVALLHETAMQGNEAAGIVWDRTQIVQRKREQIVIVPTALTVSDEDDSKAQFAFGPPETPAQKQAALKFITDTLNDPAKSEELDWLMSGKERVEGQRPRVDPKGCPIYRYDRNTKRFSPGIRSWKEAKQKLLQAAENGNLPIETGQTMMGGDIVVLMDTRNNFYLHRIGFKAHTGSEIGRLYGGGSNGVAVCKNEIEPNQTVPSEFKILSIDPDRRGVAALVEWSLTDFGKVLFEGGGYKITGVDLPAQWGNPDIPMSDNGLNISYLTGLDNADSKLFHQERADNFSVAWAIFGEDLRLFLVNGYFGRTLKDTRDPEFEDLWNLLDPVLNDWARMDHQGITADKAAENLDLMGMFADEAQNINQSLMGGKLANHIEQQILVKLRSLVRDSGGNPLLSNVPISTIQGWQGTPISGDLAVLLTVLQVLQVPGVNLSHILGTSGMWGLKNRFDEDAGIRLTMRLLTDALDNPKAFPAMKTMLIQRINDRLPTFTADHPWAVQDPSIIGKKVFRMTENWVFEIAVRDNNAAPGEDSVAYIRSTLMLATPVPADEDPNAYAQSAVMKRKNGITPHVAAVLGETIGARYIIKSEMRDGTPVSDSLDELYGKNTVERFTQASTGADFFQMLNKASYRGNPSHTVRNPRQEAHIERVFTAVRDFDYYVNREGDAWTPQKQSAVATGIEEFLAQLGITEDPTGAIARQVDTLVRLYLGRPGPMEGQTDWFDRVGPDEYLGALQHFKERAKDKEGFLLGGKLQLVPPGFLRLVYEANASNPTWAPAVRRNGNVVTLAKGWDEWVSAIFGQVMDSEEPVNTVFADEFDGLLQLWLAAERIGSVGLSLDQSRNISALKRKPNEILMSFNALTDAALNDPIFLDSWVETYDSLAGNDPVFTLAHRREAQASAIARSDDDQASWAARRKMGKQRKTLIKDYAKVGQYYIKSAEQTNVVFRNIINASIMVRMADPSIYMSGFIEQPFRRMFEHVTGLLTGTYTGPGAELIASATGGSSNFSNAFTQEDVQILKRLAKQLAEDPEWIDEIFAEMAYKGLIKPSEHGRVSRALEKGATSAAKLFSDPRFGMSPEAVAMQYLMGAISTLHMSGAHFTIATLAKELVANPLWLKTQYSDDKGFNPHRAGMNTVAHIRGMKQTPFSKAVMGAIDSMLSSNNLAANVTGLLAVIPFQFTRFTAGSLAFATGMEGWNQAFAMFFNGRKRPKFLGGNAENPYWDMNDCIETLDLQRTFIRSGATLTMVMTLGMLAGGVFNFDGEDPEEKRRRRMAKYLNLPVVLDPREPANNFLLADAIFLDSIPFLDMFYKNESGHAVVVPHWVLRQFTSPIIGMSRFFENGDLREISYGFLDAFSAIPYSVLSLWDEADVTARLLMDEAQMATEEGTEEGNARAMQLVIQMVSVYEKALLENRFINNLRTASDEYDRDPYIIPKTAEENTGELDRQQGTGFPEQTDALQAYLGVDGEVGNQYAKRQGADLQRHIYAENHATFAAVMALFSGMGDSSYLRHNMAVKQRTVQLEETSQAEAEAVIMAAYRQAGGLEELTQEEIFYKLKAEYAKADEYYDVDDLEAKAEEIYAAGKGKLGALSIISAQGQEVLTNVGGDRIIEGLKKGSIKIGDAAMQGVSMDQEMRNTIAMEMYDRLVQEGVDLGLTNQSAKFRANRFWYGDPDHPDVPGLREIIYDKRIPSSNEVVYNQLNTMYMIGPDGQPWATPFRRTSFFQAFGLPVPHKAMSGGLGMGMDSQGNMVDQVLGINTGMAGLQRVVTESDITPVDPPEITDDDDSSYGSSYTPFKFNRGWRSYARGGGGGGGGGYFQRMQPFGNGYAPRYDDIQMINTSAPIIRRSRVNRERVTSQRGRLKQWQ